MEQSIIFNNQPIEIGSKIKFEPETILTRRFNSSGFTSEYTVKLLELEKHVKEFNDKAGKHRVSDYVKLHQGLDPDGMEVYGVNAIVTAIRKNGITVKLEYICGGTFVNDAHIVYLDPTAKAKLTPARITSKKFVILKSINKYLFD